MYSYQTHSPSLRTRTFSQLTSESRNDGQPCDFDSFTNESHLTKEENKMSTAYMLNMRSEQ